MRKDYAEKLKIKSGEDAARQLDEDLKSGLGEYWTPKIEMKNNGTDINIFICYTREIEQNINLIPPSGIFPQFNSDTPYSELPLAN